MQRLVVGVDGSASAAAALDWVAYRARLSDIRVDLVSAAPFTELAERTGDRLLEDADERLRGQVPGLAVERHRTEGTPAAALREAALAADVVVLGLDSDAPLHGAFRHRLADRLSATVTTPVCLVPRTWSARADTVVAGLAPDLSSHAAVRFAAAEAEATAQRVCLVHAWERPGFLEEAAWATDAEEAQREHLNIARNAADEVRRAYPALTVVTSTPQSRPIAALIAEAAEASMLVMGTHRRSGLSTLLHGSVVRGVLGRIEVPLCIVPPADG